MTISKRCQELGEMLLDVKQDLWQAMDNLREARKTPYSFELARIWAEGAKKRYMTPFWTPEFTTEELVLLNAPIEKGLKLIKESKDIEASFAFEKARKAAHDLMFQKVVECECKKPVWKLVGIEPDRTKAETWANKMREHGEEIEVRPTAKGYEVWRKE